MTPFGFQDSRFGGISGLRDRSWRILRKISVPNDPFLWRLLTAVSRKLGTEDFEKKSGNWILDFFSSNRKNFGGKDRGKIGKNGKG